MLTWIYSIFFLLLTLFLSGVAEAISAHYRVTRIVDGDTLDATNGHTTFRVRIAGMDAPEWDQRFGRQAMNRLKQLIGNKKITLSPVITKKDRYHRMLSQVFVNKKDVSLVLIEEGLATYFRPFCRDWPADKKFYDYNPLPYIQAEQRAQKASRGIWIQENNRLPCEYRKEHPWRPSKR